MQFLHSWLLILLIVPLLLLAWTWRRRGRAVALPLDHAIPKSGRWMRGVIQVAESFPALILAIAILMLAGPYRVGEPKTKRRMTNIEFCVDISGSMTAQFGSGSRYDASMAAINDFLDYREGDAFGLTFFGNSYLHWVPLTNDVSAFRCAPPFMRPENAPNWFGGTEIGKALLACKEVLTAREEGERMILLISDGFSSDLSNGNDVEIAKRLREHEIVVYAVHIATGEIPEAIVNITSMTGGDVFNPGDPEGMRAVFQRIDQMQQTELERTTAESIDHFEPYSKIGLVLLGICSVCLLGIRYTPW